MPHICEGIPPNSMTPATHYIFIPTHCGTVITHIKSLTPCTHIYIFIIIIIFIFVILLFCKKKLVGKSDAFMYMNIHFKDLQSTYLPVVRIRQWYFHTHSTHFLYIAAKLQSKEWCKIIQTLPPIIFKNGNGIVCGDITIPEHKVWGQNIMQL